MQTQGTVWKVRVGRFVVVDGGGGWRIIGLTFIFYARDGVGICIFVLTTIMCRWLCTVMAEVVKILMILLQVKVLH